jgi:hypothetical protein
VVIAPGSHLLYDSLRSGEVHPDYHPKAGGGGVRPSPLPLTRICDPFGILRFFGAREDMPLKKLVGRRDMLEIGKVQAEPKSALQRIMVLGR